MSEPVKGMGGEQERGGEAELRETAPGETEIRPLEESLSVAQRKALVLIAEGKAIAETAKEIGVYRGTIYRWIRSDAKFRAAYNGWEAEMRESCRAEMMKCGHMAVKKIVREIDFDRTLAWKVVRELGLLKHAGNFTTDPEQVQQEIDIEAMARTNRLEERKIREVLTMVQGPPESDTPMLRAARALSSPAEDI